MFHYKILTSFDLKIIALVTMIIDHLGIIFFPDQIILRIIGRIAFVLYAFMLVEGFFLTSNFLQYFTKLSIWAFLSEVPFDLAIHNQLIYFGEQNIFFTLLLGLSSIYSLEYLEKLSTPLRPIAINFKNIFLQLIIVLLFIFLAILLRVDYSWYGILLMIIFYKFRHSNYSKFLFVEINSLIASLSMNVYQFFSFLAFIPITLYNGERGLKCGNIFYSFYALHLLIFALIKIYIKRIY